MKITNLILMRIAFSLSLFVLSIAALICPKIVAGMIVSVSNEILEGV